MRILIDGQTFETPEIDRGIGVYTRNVIEHMLKQDYGHEWYITVSDRKSLDILDPWVKEKLHVLEAPLFRPGSDYVRNNAYTRRIQKLINQLEIDALWIPNALMVNVLFLSREVTCTTFITIYDLIPYLFPIREWPQVVKEEYSRRLQLIKSTRNMVLLMISEATRKDWTKHMQEAVNTCSVTVLAADEKRFYQKRTKKNSRHPFILFTGGFDYRKNINGAIDAFARAREKHREDQDFQQYRLVIVGKYNQAVKEQYDAMLAEKKLTGLVELTGYVTDDHLAELYHQAAVFFFPSLYEGFGLPLLEAMLSGDYIVSANNSSLPEVCGNHALLFDVSDPDEMAEALWQGCRNQKEETAEDVRRRQEYARSFSWERTAGETLSVIEAHAAPVFTGGKKPRLALLTPWPPQQTGIANYEERLLPYLAEYFDITVFTAAAGENPACSVGRDIRSLDEFPSCSRDYDYKLYQLGNNAEFHKDLFELLEKEGGIAEIHDYILAPFFWCCYQDDLPRWEALLKSGYGSVKGESFFRETLEKGTNPDIYECPMSDSVAAIADRTIFHNHWSAERVKRKNSGMVPLAAFPLAAPPAKALAKKTRELKERIRYCSGEIIIGCFGWINSNKRPWVVIEAVRQLLQSGYALRLIFWGKCNMPALPDELKAEGLTDRVIISGYLDEGEYYAALRMTDIVVNLRYPSMGESSATLCETFQMSKPAIVSDVNQYREFPDEICWKLPIGENEVPVLRSYLEKLIENGPLRRTMGSAARRFAEQALNPSKIARLYYDCITRKTPQKKTKPYAFVIPWYGDDIKGGAESECNQLAHLFWEEGVPVEVLTTCVRQASDDRSVNTLPAGLHEESGIPVRRFPVKRQNMERFSPANWKLYCGKPVTLKEEAAYLEEDINSPELYRYIHEHRDDYEAFIFLPYLYGPTYFGSMMCPDNAVIIPCFHDEGYAHMALMKARMKHFKKMIFLSRPESDFANQVYDLSDVENAVLGAYVESGWEKELQPERFREKYRIHAPFLLCAGRKDPGKKTDLLLQYFCRFLDSHPESPIQLVLIGGGEIDIPETHRGQVRDLGFVSQEDKHDAFAAALALCNPSFFESFSIVIMESWLAGRPVLVSEQCRVTTNFCRESGGGLWFWDYPSFEGSLDYLLANPEQADRMGEKGSRYVRDHFTRRAIFNAYSDFLSL